MERQPQDACPGTLRLLCFQKRKVDHETETRRSAALRHYRPQLAAGRGEFGLGDRENSEGRGHLPPAAGESRRPGGNGAARSGAAAPLQGLRGAPHHQRQCGGVPTGGRRWRPCGQTDMAVPGGRAILGPDKIIGTSAHNVAEAKAAAAAGADYIGCGAVFGSTTKGDASLLAREELARICRAVSLPAVAIGGIPSGQCGAAGGDRHRWGGGNQRSLCRRGPRGGNPPAEGDGPAGGVLLPAGPGHGAPPLPSPGAIPAAGREFRPISRP